MDVMAKTESRVNCVCSVGGGRNMGLMIDDDEEEEEKLFCCCFLAAFTLADSTA